MSTLQLSLLNNRISKARKMLDDPFLKPSDRAYWQDRLERLLAEREDLT